MEGNTMKKFLGAIGLATGLAFANPAGADVPKNGLGAIAVSPDGATVVAAGDNRVMYVLDPETLAVTRLVWTGINPLEAFFSKDGKTIVVHTTDNTLMFYKAETLELKTTVGKVSHVAVAETANLIVTAGRSRGRDEEAKTPVTAYDMSTGKEVYKTELAIAANGIGVTPDGSRIFSLSRPIKDLNEAKKKPPKGMRGLERDIFKQKNDEKVSLFVVQGRDGKELVRSRTWYSSYNKPILVPKGDGVLAINYVNINAEFDGAGKAVRIFKMKHGYNYGLGFSGARGIIAGGGLRDGSVLFVDGDKKLDFRVERIGGWPEYFKGLAIGPDRSIYGGTSAYRLIKVSPDGTSKVIPVY